MICPNCSGVVVWWSDPGQGSFGNACLGCKLFVWDSAPGEERSEIRSMPLDLAPFPRAHTRIPRYRAAVNYVGPIQ